MTLELRTLLWATTAHYSPQPMLLTAHGYPHQVLDAPALQDDFYLNLVDWSSQNVLAVGLDNCVYLWSAYTSVVRGGGVRFDVPISSRVLS